MAHPVNSAVTIAKLLSTEGFNDHIANRIESYWKRSAGLTDRQRKQLARLEKEFSRIMSVMSTGDRLIVGRFIGLHKKMSLETGLRIGIQAFAVKTQKEIEIDAGT